MVNFLMQTTDRSLGLLNVAPEVWMLWAILEKQVRKLEVNILNNSWSFEDSSNLEKGTRVTLSTKQRMQLSGLRGLPGWEERSYVSEAKLSVLHLTLECCTYTLCLQSERKLRQNFKNFKARNVTTEAWWKL